MPDSGPPCTRPSHGRPRGHAWIPGEFLLASSSKTCGAPEALRPSFVCHRTFCVVRTFLNLESCRSDIDVMVRFSMSAQDISEHTCFCVQVFHAVFWPFLWCAFSCYCWLFALAGNSLIWWVTGGWPCVLQGQCDRG